jgi:hypothetical protein
MTNLPKLPDSCWARIELVKREAARKRTKAVQLARAELKHFDDPQRAEILKALDPKWDITESRRESHRHGLIFAHADYLAAVFLATIVEIRKVEGTDFGVEALNQSFLELLDKSFIEWRESGGDAAYTDTFIAAAVAAVKNDTRYPNLLSAMVSSAPNHEPESAASVAAGKETARNPAGASESHRSRKGDVTLLWDPEGKLKEAVSRVHATEYLGVTPRQVQRLVSKEILTVIGGGQNKQIMVSSLLEYLPTKKRT